MLFVSKFFYTLYVTFSTLLYPYNSYDNSQEFIKDFANKSGLCNMFGVPNMLPGQKDSNFNIYWHFKSNLGAILNYLTDFDVIPVNSNHKPYIINIIYDTPEIQKVVSDCLFCYYTKWQDKKCNTSLKQQPCKFMVKYGRPCNFLNTINENCDDAKKQKIILNHLSKYDHFEYFGKKRPQCPFKNNDKCIHFQRILKNNNEYSFIDKKHLYYYYHKPSNRHFCLNCQYSDDKPLFEFTSVFERKTRANLRFSKLQSFEKIHTFFLLIGEILSNGFEDDLIPTQATAATQFDGTEYINNILKQYTNIGVNRIDLSAIIDKLKTKYDIFNILNEKMDHEKHKEMDCVLCESEMLALILYCNGDCNHNLCLTQRDGTYIKKWPTFDMCLNNAIWNLDKYESHDKNIYTGLSGVFVDIYELYRQGGLRHDALKFKSNISFTTDLNVAYGFRGAEGLILGINLKQRFDEDTWGFGTTDFGMPLACDVSWISKFTTEKEMLMTRDSLFSIYASNSMQIENKQWIVGNLGYDDKTFERMFLTNKQQLQ